MRARRASNTVLLALEGRAAAIVRVLREAFEEQPLLVARLGEPEEGQRARAEKGPGREGEGETGEDERAADVDRMPDETERPARHEAGLRRRRRKRRQRGPQRPRSPDH